MSLSRRLPLLLAMTLLIGLLAYPASAQITNVANTTSTPTPGVGHDYLQFLNETVNPANGSVSLRIAVPVPPARKLTIPFAFAYDSNGVNHLVGKRGSGFGWLSNQGFISQGGWSYTLPQLSAVQSQLIYPNPDPNLGGNLTCNWLGNYVLQDPSAGRHSLFLSWLQDTNGQCTLAGLSNMLNGGDGFYTGAVVQAGTSLQQAVYVADNDGTVYYFPSLPEVYKPPFPYVDTVIAGLPAWVEDRNGNGPGDWSTEGQLGRRVCGLATGRSVA